MEYNELIEKVEKIRNGVFTRLSYHTELPVKSSFAKSGIKVVKETETTTRFGVFYGNIKTVRERNEEKKLEDCSSEKKERKNNFVSVVPNKVVFNTNTNKYYLCSFPTKSGTNTVSRYKVFENDSLIKICDNIKEIEEYIINSYLNKKSSFTETYRVSIENVDRIGR